MHKKLLLEFNWLFFYYKYRTVIYPFHNISQNILHTFQLLLRSGYQMNIGISETLFIERDYYTSQYIFQNCEMHLVIIKTMFKLI